MNISQNVVGDKQKFVKYFLFPVTQLQNECMLFSSDNQDLNLLS